MSMINVTNITEEDVLRAILAEEISLFKILSAYGTQGNREEIVKLFRGDAFSSLALSNHKAYALIGDLIDSLEERLIT